MVDPIFGPAEVPSNQLSPTPLQMLGLMCCPCCVLRGAPGCCIGFHQLRTPRMMQVWRRLLYRAAVWLVVIDTLLFIVEIIVNGGFQPIMDVKCDAKAKAMAGEKCPQSNPMIGPSYETLVVMGCKDMPRMVYENQWWRLATPIVLHSGVLHIAFNLMATFRMGLVMEEKWGTKIWLTIYLLSGLAGSLFSCAFRPATPGVGASGSLFGLMGGMIFITLFPSGNDDPMERYLQIVACIASMLMGIAISLAPLVDWSAHLGGWLAGFWLAAIFLLPAAPRSAGGASIWRRLISRRHCILSTSFCLAMALLLCYVLFIVPVRPHTYQKHWMEEHGEWPPRRYPNA